MRDASTTETVNREQLATATDRLLLGSGRVAARGRSTPPAPHARGSIPSIARAPVVRGSHPHILPRPLACGSQRIAARP